MERNDQGPGMQAVSCWPTVVCASLAGGMGWGIRGQYGHETGAMIAGVLVCLVIAVTLCQNASALAVARAVALGTIAMGFGGTETYGQTVGLTHDPELVGNWAALRWGMLGLGIKGAAWIGFCGVFLGMGLGGTRYRGAELLLLMLGTVAACMAGLWMFNLPFDLEHRRLPMLYFSATWDLFPNKANLEPRFEWWGGLWLALLLVIAYAGAVRKDGLAWRMGLWGILGGAIGFPLGQCIQAYHAWERAAFTGEFWGTLNYWNFMETTFGLTMGAMLGLGAWVHRARIRPVEYERDAYLSGPIEWTLLFVHGALLVLSEFWIPFPIVGLVYDLGLVMGVIPMFAIAGGRWWPYFAVFPVTLLPIAGKTVRDLVYENHAIAPVPGWTVYFAVPMAVSMAAAFWFYTTRNSGQSSRAFAGYALLICAWTYFALNFAFFRFPWPWQTWTARTPNAIVFAVCLAILTWLGTAAVRTGPSRKRA